MFNLGYMSIRGIHAPQNYTQARLHFEAAAAKDLPAAWNGLGEHAHALRWAGLGWAGLGWGAAASALRAAGGPWSVRSAAPLVTPASHCWPAWHGLCPLQSHLTPPQNLAQACSTSTVRACPSTTRRRACTLSAPPRATTTPPSTWAPSTRRAACLCVGVLLLPGHGVLLVEPPSTWAPSTRWVGGWVGGWVESEGCGAVRLLGRNAGSTEGRHLRRARHAAPAAHPPPRLPTPAAPRAGRARRGARRAARRPPVPQRHRAGQLARAAPPAGAARRRRARRGARPRRRPLRFLAVHGPDERVEGAGAGGGQAARGGRRARRRGALRARGGAGLPERRRQPGLAAAPRRGAAPRPRAAPPGAGSVGARRGPQPDRGHADGGAPAAARPQVPAGGRCAACRPGRAGGRGPCTGLARS